MVRKRRKTDSTSNIFTRFMFVCAFLAIWIGAIGVRLVYLQVNEHSSYRSQVLDQSQYVVETKTLRGSIFDRNGRPLAMSMKVKSLYADPVQMTNVAETTEAIGKLLKINARDLAKKIEDEKKLGRQFLWVAHKLEKEQVDEVNERIINAVDPETGKKRYTGLQWVQEQKRTYPHGTMAANVIGFTNAADKGQAGIELSQDDYLQGENVRKVRERDRLGRIYDEWGHASEESEDVVLTLDNAIQSRVEEALAAGSKRANVRSGRAIVLDPKTGEVLAMANFPSYDPNNFRALKPGDSRNSAIQDNFTPGSIFKLVTYGAALEEKLIAPDSELDCGDGTITVANHTFTDSHAVGTVSYTQAFAQSSNVGAIKTGLKVGKESFFDYVKKFGFGKPTGIELPAEANGMLRDPKNWNGDSLASMSIGYEIGVTALQSATAFATIANDGVKIQPHIVKEIRKSNGEVVSATEPKTQRVVSSETARKLRAMMREVVLDGTAKKAQLKGYTAAGKTGTAWKYDPQIKAINRSKYFASFIGYAPANDPKIVIAVVMDEPRGPWKYGGEVAAPVFSEIAEQVLPILHIAPDKEVIDDATLESGVTVAKSTTEGASQNAESTVDPNSPSNIVAKKQAATATKNIDRRKEVPKRSPEPAVDMPEKRKRSGKTGSERVAFVGYVRKEFET
ncbi:MAG: peptidoglycan D,D-transpeptidase FtsI family protein [Pyrinomonadaceae bacterium]